MAERSWIEPWPAWIRRWYGFASRVLLGGLGALTGLGLIWLASFGATFKKTQAEWDSESLTILFLGIGTVVIALAVAFKPSRFTFALAALTAMAIPVVGAAI